ncbi:unnamed protein product [Urochloa humidicola]
MCPFILLPYCHHFHWILFAIEIEYHRVWVYDSLRQDKEMYQDLVDLINKAWARFYTKVLKVKETLDPLEFKTDFPCLRQEQGNNLCGYYVCEFIDNFVNEKGQMTPEAFKTYVMREDLIEDARIRAIQDSIAGFLLDQVIAKDGEFYTNEFDSVGLLDKKRQPV